MDVPLSAQPDDVSCGPTCLAGVYRFWGQPIEITELRDHVRTLPHGGTLAVFLAIDALRRGFAATIYTYNLSLFDPTWFSGEGIDLSAKLIAQAEAKHDVVLRSATAGYLELLRLGGKIRYEELNRALLTRILDSGAPIIAGLSSTYLHNEVRETAMETLEDDIRGEPAGHFVVLSDINDHGVEVRDPYQSEPDSAGRSYTVGHERLIGAILLGALTYDANILVIRPRQ